MSARFRRAVCNEQGSEADEDTRSRERYQ